MPNNTITIAGAKTLVDSLLESLDQVGDSNSKYHLDFGFQLVQQRDLTLTQLSTLLRKARHALSEFDDAAPMQLALGAGVINDLEVAIMTKTKEIHEEKQAKARPKIQEIPKKLIVPTALADKEETQKQKESKIIVDSSGK